MTNEQINQRIAEACPDKFRTENGVWFFQYDKDCWSQCHNNSTCTDLNAMHEAEKVLIKGFEDDPESSELWSDYQTNLIIACPAYLSYHATARQRAEAFLRTLGKWEEVQR